MSSKDNKRRYTALFVVMVHEDAAQPSTVLLGANENLRWATIFLLRGCCGFCTSWRHKFAEEIGELVPLIRVRAVERHVNLGKPNNKSIQHVVSHNQDERISVHHQLHAEKQIVMICSFENIDPDKGSRLATPSWQNMNDMAQI